MTARSKATVLEGLLVAMMAAAALTLVLLPALGTGGLGVVGGSALTVEAELRDPVPIPGLRVIGDGQAAAGEAVELGSPATVTASVPTPSWPQRLGLVGSELVTGLTAVGVLWLLLQVTRTVRQGDVFIPANARRLQTIAALVAVGGTLAQLLHAVGRSAVLEAASVRDQVVASFELSFVPVVAAVGIGVAAEVFRQGTALREDVEGLV